MLLLQKTIKEQGLVLDGNVLKVDSFLNHMIDPQLMDEIGKEFCSRFKDEGISKILTVESSGIAPAVFTGLYLKVPVVFAKKTAPSNMGKDKYSICVHSYTREKDYDICISADYIYPDDRVLIIDDFLARGQAVLGLKSLVEMAGSKVAGVGIVIEKGFQDGGERLRSMGLKLESLAIVEYMSKEEISFRQED